MGKSEKPGFIDSVKGFLGIESDETKKGLGKIKRETEVLKGNSIEKKGETITFTFSKTGKELGDVHNDLYKDLVKSLENILKKGGKRITGIKSEIRENSNKTFTIIYRVDITEEKDPKKQDHHIELKTHVWREKGKAKDGVEKLNKDEIPKFKEKWEKTYSGTHYHSTKSGDKDLYNAGIIALAREKK